MLKKIILFLVFSFVVCELFVHFENGGAIDILITSPSIRPDLNPNPSFSGKPFFLYINNKEIGTLDFDNFVVFRNPAILKLGRNKLSIRGKDGTVMFSQNLLYVFVYSWYRLELSSNIIYWDRLFIHPYYHLTSIGL